MISLLTDTGIFIYNNNISNYNNNNNNNQLYLGRVTRDSKN